MSETRRFVFVIASIWLGLASVSFVRMEGPEFRPWERLYDHDVRRFKPGRQIRMSEIGDLGFKTWDRSLQQPRETIFTTDQWGYRNPVEIDAPEIVVIGDSYVAGSGLSDDEVVSRRLSDQLGTPVYNFAGENLNAPAEFMRNPRFAEQRPKLVIWAPVARGIAARPLFYRGESGASEDAPSGLIAWLTSIPESIRASLEGLNRDNGLVRESRFALQAMLGQTGGEAWVRQLPSGDRVLALGLGEQNLLATPEHRNVDHCIQMVVALSQIMKKAGIRFVFSPIPESGTIYPEIFPASERSALPAESFLSRLITGVRLQGVEVVDLSTVFRAEPEPYLYLPDDTHWNARATDLAAQAWAGLIRGDSSELHLSGQP